MKHKLGDALPGGRIYVGRATTKNMLVAARMILKSGTKILKHKRNGPFLYLKVRKGKQQGFIALQNVGGLTYCGMDELAQQALA